MKRAHDRQEAADEHRVRAPAVEKAIREFDFVRHDQNVAPVFQQQPAPAARIDEIGDVRPKQASHRAGDRPRLRSKRPVDTR